MSRWLGGLADKAVRTAGLARQQGGWRSSPCDKGFGASGRHPHRWNAQHSDWLATSDVHNATPLCRSARALTVRLHSVSSGVGAGISTSGIDMRGAQATLTVEIHRLASGFRRRISTSETVGFVASFVSAHRSNTQRRAWVCRLDISPEHAGRAIAGSLSPLKYTGLRLAGGVVVHARNCVASRPYAHSHH